jgi:hypothetical protein
MQGDYCFLSLFIFRGNIHLTPYSLVAALALTTQSFSDALNAWSSLSLFHELFITAVNYSADIHRLLLRDTLLSLTKTSPYSYAEISMCRRTRNRLGDACHVIPQIEQPLEKSEKEIPTWRTIFSHIAGTCWPWPAQNIRVRRKCCGAA